MVKTFSNPAAGIHCSHDSDQTLSNYLMWASPVPHFNPRRKHKNSDLTIACIVSDKLFQSLQYEASILLLTKQNWKTTLRYSRPAFLLMESYWETATGDWYQSQIHPGEEFDNLVEIIAYAKVLGIPTVFWNTQDVLYHDLFKKIAPNFDYVFCADPLEKSALQDESIRAEILLPAVQPAIFNPFRDYNFANAFEIKILFDGWADLFRLSADLEVLKPLREIGLSIIESNYRLFSNKLDDTPEYADSLLGCVNQANRLMALKYAKICVMADSSIATRIRQQWMSLENSACRLPVLFRGLLDQDDVRKGTVIEFADDKALFKQAEHLVANDIDRENKAHIAWRKVYSKHSFSHRLKTICTRLQIGHSWNEYPSVSVIIPTFRTNLIEKCIKQFNSQNYPNKELILILNTNTLTYADLARKIGKRNDINHFVIPPERVEGGCANVGVMAATCEHIIKMDDDDLYSNNFVQDMILWNRAIDADIYGKTNCYFHFQDDDTTYSREKSDSPPLTVIPLEKMPVAHISGNSLSGKTAYFKKHRYSDNNMASTDTCYHNNINDKNATFALLDKLGAVVEREVNTSDHSWRVDSDKLKRSMHFVSEGIPKGLLG